MTWTLIEPCAGTAALSMHLLNARRQLVPRQGSKWSLRRPLADLLLAVDVWGPPQHFVLSDASPWALVVEAVLRHRDDVVRALVPLVAAGEDAPDAVYRSLHGAPVPTDRVQAAAELLWLQRMAFSGKAVRVRDGRWAASGLNTTSAHGVAGTDRFGPVRPLGRALLEAVSAAPQTDRVTATMGLVRHGDLLLAGPCVTYIDPPYLGTSGYGPDDLNREGLIELARDWHKSGAVLVSEAEPIAELVALGWRASRIASPTRESPFRTRSDEWVTWIGAP